MFSKPSFLVLSSLFLVAAACSSPSAEPPSPAPKPAATAAKAPVPTVTTPPAPIAAAVAAPPVAPPPKSASKASGLAVKRFVIATAVEGREPVLADSIELGELPVFAFAELANGGDAEGVVITFEREGSSESVGHVELSVPAETQRWRTWGKTNLITKSGRWSAVLRDQGGKELARTPFEVTKLTSEGDGRMAPGS